MAGVVLPVNYTPRPYQVPFWQYMQGGGKRYNGVWHRRAGKDRTVLAWTSVATQQRVGIYWHVFPTLTLGRKILWNGRDDSGWSFMSAFPDEIVERRRDDEMITFFKNGSIHQIVSAEDPDQLRGPNPVGIVFSEWAVMNPEVWSVIKPILSQNNGWAIFIYTPKGRNHGYDNHIAAQKIDGWKAELLTVRDTKKPDPDNPGAMIPVVDQKMIQEDRDLGYPEEFIQQEYYCSFDAALVGSYYKDQVRKLREEGRVGTTDEFQYDPDMPVYTWWDIGLNDETVVVYFQRAGRRRIFIGFDMTSDWSLEEWVQHVLNKPYTYARHIGPWDLRVRDPNQRSKMRRYEFARKLGLRFHVAAKAPIADGVAAVRRAFSDFWINESLCVNELKGKFQGAQLLDMLGRYSKKPDRNNPGLFLDEPKHDECSHVADAVRIGVMEDVDSHRFDDDYEHRQQTAIMDYDEFHSTRVNGSGTMAVRQEYAFFEDEW